MATITATASGGTRAWSASATWDLGRAPLASDDVVLASTSGPVTIDTGAVCRSLDCQASGNYANTLTHTAAVTLTIGDATAGAGNVAFRLSSTMTYTLGGTSNSAISFISTSATVQTITCAGKATGNLTFNAASNGSWKHADGNSLVGTYTFTKGTIDLNGQTFSWGAFSSSNSNTRTLTMGAAAITVTNATSTSWNCVTVTGLTVTANTAIVTMSGTTATFAGGKDWNGMSVVMSGDGTCVISGSPTFKDFTRTGAASKNCALQLGGTSTTCTGTFTINGNSTINRLLLQSNALGTQRTVTAATVVASNVDIQDVAGAGAGSWNLSAITGLSGDCLGNTGITFTTPTTQHFTNTNGGAWSTVGNWTSRIPLPQDTVIVDAALGAAKTITADMNRIGADITISQTVAFTYVGGGTFYGSFTMSANATAWNGGTFGLAPQGRGTHTFTTAGKTVPHSVIFGAFGGSYTLQDDWTSLTSLLFFAINAGTVDLNGKNVTTARFLFDAGSNTRGVTTSGGTLTATNVGSAGSLWGNSQPSGMTCNVSSASIVFSDTSSTAKTFAGGGFTYGTFSVANLGGAALAITGNNTFSTLSLACATASTVTLPASGSTRITNSLTLAGASGATLLSFVSSTPGTSTTLNSVGIGPLSISNTSRTTDVIFQLTYYGQSTDSVSTSPSIQKKISSNKTISEPTSLLINRNIEKKTTASSTSNLLSFIKNINININTSVIATSSSLIKSIKKNLAASTEAVATIITTFIPGFINYLLILSASTLGTTTLLKNIKTYFVISQSQSSALIKFISIINSLSQLNSSTLGKNIQLICLSNVAAASTIIKSILMGLMTTLGTYVSSPISYKDFLSIPFRMVGFIFSASRSRLMASNRGKNIDTSIDNNVSTSNRINPIDTSIDNNVQTHLRSNPIDGNSG